jgi:ATP-dependent DNA helicase RecQ
MSANSLLWQLAYQLCGITTMGRTHLEPLGSLPVPLRRAVLEVVHDIDPQAVVLKLGSKQLLNAADPGRSNYTWVEEWRFAREELKDFIESTKDGVARYTSLEEYQDQHALGKPKDDGPDEHYADRIFLQESFLPVFGMAGLSLLNSQYTLRETTGRKRRVDFLLFGGARYAFEVEAFPYQDAFWIDDRRFDETKQKQMGSSGGSVIYKRFSLDEIRNGDAETRLRDMALNDSILRDLVRPDKEQRAAREGLSLFYLQDLLGRFPLRRSQSYGMRYPRTKNV